MNKKYQDIFTAWASVQLEEIVRNSTAESSGPIALVVSRNEQWRLPAFLAHYRNLGISRFIFLDNGSTDTTIPYLAQQHDVDRYRCADKFSSYAQRGWMHRLIEMYGYDQWYLALDADEMLVYDGMSAHSFTDLIQLAEKEGVTRIRGIMIDMYGEGTLQEHMQITDYPDVIQYCSHFDTLGYTLKVASHRISVTGGPRKRMFQRLGHTDFPELTKYPLFKAEKNCLMTGAHHLLPLWKNFQSKCTLGILHYKYSKQDLVKIKEALEAQQHWNGSMEYKCYAQWLAQYPHERLFTEGTKHFLSPTDLVETKLITPLQWANTHSKQIAFPPLQHLCSSNKLLRRQAYKYTVNRLTGITIQSNYLSLVRKLRKIP